MSRVAEDHQVGKAVVVQVASRKPMRSRGRSDVDRAAPGETTLAEHQRDGSGPSRRDEVRDAVAVEVAAGQRSGAGGSGRQVYGAVAIHVGNERERAGETCRPGPRLSWLDRTAVVGKTTLDCAW